MPNNNNHNNHNNNHNNHNNHQSKKKNKQKQDAQVFALINELGIGNQYNNNYCYYHN